jgi:DnaK suppressor protein
VTSAIQKLEDGGGFGECERCGEEIAEKRLEALPFARYCIECQRAAEEEERTAAG